MEKALAVINQMQADGVIGKYAIGGAVGAFFYIEPSATDDLDIFITLESQPGEIATLTPIYDYLLARGYHADRETILIDNWAVQFLPAGTPLLSEALDKAKERRFGNQPTRVLPAEYLMAVALQTGRGKDMARLAQFIEEEVADETVLKDILARHHLMDKWQAFNKRILP